MITCAICYEEEIDAMFCEDCNVMVCQDCFLEWTQTLIQGTFIQKNE